MIDRVIQRPFLLWQAEALVGAGEPREELPPEATDIAPGELADAKEAVAEAVARERERPLTPAPPGSEDRRGSNPPAIEHLSYFPRDPVLSIVQTAVEQYLEEHAPRLLKPTAETDRRRSRGALAAASAIADYTLDIPDDAIPDERADDRRLGGAFEITDPGWISSLVAMGWRKLKGRRAFNDSPAPPRELAADARLIVVGDWASGIERARRVAAEMRKTLDAPEASGRECHVIHLGDTYYAGWDYEYRKRFLPHWPVRAGEPHGSWSLNGNHDMYTGGHGYFDVLLAEGRFAPFHQGSSWFSLENEHWQLLGLDTAWEDHGLVGSQPEWIEQKLQENPERRTMLMSHHQLFSAFNRGGPKLATRLAGALATNRIDAWLWGHEHRCVVYEPAERVGSARCIGHGGVPVYADRSHPPPVRWRLTQSFRSRLEEWALCGFAILDFDGPSIQAQYVNEFGGIDYTETI